jgi:transcriptional regulator with XRE-family HTH domain
MSPSRRPSSSSSSPSRVNGAEITRTTKRHSRLDPTESGSVVVRRGAQETRHSMRTIALGTGLSISEVSRVLNGQRVGRVQTLTKLAAHLGVTLDTLNAYLIPRRPTRLR